KKKKYAVKKRIEGESYRDFDIRKLKAYTKETAIKYKYGIYIEFGKDMDNKYNLDTVCELKFFQNGEEIK
ncbi:MAG: hypothetical protein KAS11_00250, partial [Candidatus Aenigmarchaeota archaeon]|nr:hypothetical protein [Candidatus Aenigmarchaeota archaeon]